MKPFNHHTHSLFCDGHSEPEKYVEEAINQGFEFLGFSSHAPVPFENKWSIKPGKLVDYVREINRIKTKFEAQIPVYLSLEIDYIPEITRSFNDFKSECNLDYVIGGVHLVKHPESGKLWFIDGPAEGYNSGLTEIFNNNITYGVSSYYKQIQKMITNEKPDIVAHFDKIKMNNRGRFFNTNENWYTLLVDETLDIIQSAGTIVEANTRGIYKGKSAELFPSEEILKKCLKMKIPVTISTDAHQPDEISGYFNETATILKGLGFKSLMVFRENSWNETRLD